MNTPEYGALMEIIIAEIVAAHKGSWEKLASQWAQDAKASGPQRTGRAASDFPEGTAGGAASAGAYIWTGGI